MATLDQSLTPDAAPTPARTGRVLLARLDSMGDVLLTGAAVRAVAASAAEVTMLVAPGQAGVARLLPGVDGVLAFEAPWVVFNPPPVQPAVVEDLVRRVRQEHFDLALIFTSFHQSPLPLALLLRMAGVGWVGAVSEDYPGSLLDLRHREAADLHEAERGLSLAVAAGFAPDAAGAALAIRRPLPDPSAALGTFGRTGGPYVVFHPGAATSARRPTAEVSRAMVSTLVEAGHRVVVTGSAAESTLTGYVVAGLDPERVLDLAGRCDLPMLAAVLARAGCVVAPNTGPAHLAAAVGTPVVSLFAPVVPAERWRPYGVPVRVLGDQDASCRGTRARVCPTPGHPCLSSIPPSELLAAVDDLLGVEVSEPKGRCP
jgi:ADP-heptose:LPS heptosyltransferase